jgi:ribonucleoside-diphosphate reductase alpha chain
VTGRRRLPDRRNSETFTFEAGGLRYTATVGRYPDGRIGEIFIGNHRVDSAADASARDQAILASLALQFGASIDVLRKALLRDASGRPNTPICVALDLLSAEERR